MLRDRRQDHGQARDHRFNHGVGLALEGAGGNESVGGFQPFGHVIAVSEESDAATSRSLQRRAFGTAADDRQSQRRIADPGYREGEQQCRDPLLGDEAGNRDEQGFSLLAMDAAGRVDACRIDAVGELVAAPMTRPDRQAGRTVCDDGRRRAADHLAGNLLQPSIAMGRRTLRQNPRHPHRPGRQPRPYDHRGKPALNEVGSNAPNDAAKVKGAAGIEAGPVRQRMASHAGSGEMLDLFIREARADMRLDAKFNESRGQQRNLLFRPSAMKCRDEVNYSGHWSKQYQNPHLSPRSKSMHAHPFARCWS